jgi:hypothetical protein
MIELKAASRPAKSAAWLVSLSPVLDAWLASYAEDKGYKSVPELIAQIVRDFRESNRRLEPAQRERMVA